MLLYDHLLMFPTEVSRSLALVSLSACGRKKLTPGLAGRDSMEKKENKRCAGNVLLNVNIHLRTTRQFYTYSYSYVSLMVRWGLRLTYPKIRYYAFCAVTVCAFGTFLPL